MLLLPLQYLRSNSYRFHIGNSDALADLHIYCLHAQIIIQGPVVQN